MATEAQIAANRENAKRSTGPRTIQGKARSALNALKHGFRSRIILEESKPFTDESAAPYASFLADLVAEVQPVGVRESLCAETMAISMWRQRLVIRRELELVLEATPFQREWHKIEEEMYQEDLEDGLNPPPPDLQAHFPNPEKLLPLMRYEAHLDRQYQRAQRQLQQLQVARFAGDRRAFLSPPSSPAPIEPDDSERSAPLPDRQRSSNQNGLSAADSVAPPTPCAVPNEPNFPPLSPAPGAAPLSGLRQDGGFVPNEPNRLATPSLQLDRRVPTLSPWQYSLPNAPGLANSPLFDIARSLLDRRLPLATMPNKPNLADGPFRCPNVSRFSTQLSEEVGQRGRSSSTT